MELICTRAHNTRTNTYPCLCKHVATFSVTPKCSHVHTTLSLSPAQAHEHAQFICAQIICTDGMETRPLPSPPSLT